MNRNHRSLPGHRLPHHKVVAFLEGILERVFTEDCRLETAHSEALQKLPKGERQPYQSCFHDARALLTHWRLLSYLADMDLSLEASRVRTLWPVLQELHAKAPGMDGICDEKKWPSKWKSVLSKAVEIPEIFFSYPDPFFHELCSSFPGSATEVLQYLNQPTAPDIRVNTLKTDKDSVMQSLIEEGFEVVPVGPDALQVSGEKNLYFTQAYCNGEFEIQDRHSQLVAPFTGVKPGNRVLDACAGAGGKTLHLAALMQNHGRLIAIDIFPQKLEQLDKRARRAGAHCIETRLKTSTKTVKRLKASMDVVLLDVPCSGSGTVRQHPEIKWLSTPENRKTIQETQEMLLRQHAPVVKPGGALIYSTCSLLNRENGHQIDTFLGGHPEFEEEARVTTYPQPTGGHGFFMCRLRKHL